jgi:hypothetical protein
MKVLLRLYPAAWRERYEDEVAQLLDDSSAGLADALGLLRGAFQAHRHPARSGLPAGGIRRWVTRQHIAGAAAVVGGALWLGTYTAPWHTAVGGWTPNPDLRAIALLAGAGPMLLVAAVGFMPRLSSRWPDRSLRSLALAALVVGVGLMSGMLIWTGLSREIELVPHEHQDVLLIGTAFVLLGSIGAVVSMRGRDIASRRALLSLLGACLIDLTFFAVFVDAGFVYEVTSVAGATAGILVALGWIWVGWSAMRRSPLTVEDHATAIRGPHALA